MYLISTKFGLQKWNRGYIMHPTTERTVDKPDKRLEEGGAAERIKSIREAKERLNVLGEYGRR